MQYFLNKRLDNLKDLTWAIYDVKNEKIEGKILSKEDKLKEINAKTPRRSSIKSISQKLTSSTKDIFSGNQRKSMNKIDENSLNLQSETSTKSENKLSDNNQKNLSNEQLNSDTEITSTERLSMDLDSEDLKAIKGLILKTKIYRFLGSNFFKILVVAISYGFVILGQISINGVLEIITIPNLCDFRNMPLSNGISSLISTITVVMASFVVYGMIITDIVIFTKENGFKPKLYFGLDDPFRFRIEIFIDLIFLFFAHVLSLSTFVLNFITQRTTVDPVTTVRGEIGGVLLSIFLIGIEWFILLAMGGLALILSMISAIKRKFEPVIYESEFDAFINTKEGKLIFKKYAKKEWSLENILFYEEIEKYKKIKSLKFAKKRAQELLENYIEAGSALEVNMSGEIRRLTKKRIQNFKDHKNEFKEIFDEAIKETKRNMRDTYARIRKTLEFSIWRTSSKALIDESMLSSWN